MRIAKILLSWFRGAAESAVIGPECKSIVVYGVNGSGKSSFVDAVEYVLNDGKLGHLTHEYSGKHQEKALLNTHRPKGSKAKISIAFEDKSELRVDISSDGSATKSGAEAGGIGAWDYRRTVLRQDEVAAFIHDTKGGKYSALLPLLGLHPLEIAAENLRQLGKVVEQQSKVRELTGALKEVHAQRQNVFGNDSDHQLVESSGPSTSSIAPTNRPRPALQPNATRRLPR